MRIADCEFRIGLALIATVALCAVAEAQGAKPIAVLEDLQRSQWKGQPSSQALGELPFGTDDVSLSKDGGWLYDRRTYRDFRHENAVRAVRQWTFNPARVNAAPVPICVTVEVFFEMR